MKVTVEGTLEQVEATLLPEQINHRAQKGESQNALLQKEIAEQRKIIRQAFDLVRYKKEREGEMRKLLDALAGRTGYTQSAMVLAKKIIAEHA